MAPPPLDPERTAGTDQASGNLLSRVPWWGWAIGAGVVVAAVGGTAYGISQANQPATGTVTIRW